MKAWQLPLVAMATVSTGAYAVEADGIMLGSGVTVLPGVELSISDNNNTYLEESNTNSSTITRVRPNVGLNADLGAAVVNAFYQFESATYSADSDDNYLDHLLTLGAEYEATSRVSVAGAFNFTKGHDDRGTGSLQTETTNERDPSEYSELTLGASATYGADSAFANVTGYVERYGKEYDNNEDITDTLNYDKTTVGAELALKVSPDTKVLFDISNAEISYDDSAASAKEGSLVKFLVGASWNMTGKTTGEFKIGTAKRSFDDSTFDDNSSFSWEGNVSWSPKSYSTVTFMTSQSSNESTGIGTYVDNSYTMVNWDHEFSTMWAMNVMASLNGDDYVDGDRKDTTKAFTIAGIYSPMKMLDVKAGLDISKRDSDAADADYSKRVISVGATLAF